MWYLKKSYLLSFQMAKHLCEKDVDAVYKEANGEKFSWGEIINDTSHTYLNDFSKAHNLPMTFIMGSLVPAVASVCGSKTVVQTGNFINPLNTFAFVVGDPGCGKSRCMNMILKPMHDKIREKHGVAIAMENYTSAGFQRHQKENDGYGLINSGEGGRILGSIRQKISKNEGEESRLNSVWDGVGDETILKDGTRGYTKTSVSMVLYIQPEPLISDMSYLYSKNGFFERILVFCSGPMLYKSAENKQAAKQMKRYPKDVWGLLADAIFKLHKEESRIYVLDDEAAEFFNEFTDQYNASIMARHYPEEVESEEEEDGKSKHDFS